MWLHNNMKDWQQQEAEEVVAWTQHTCGQSQRSKEGRRRRKDKHIFTSLLLFLIIQSFLIQKKVPSKFWKGHYKLVIQASGPNLLCRPELETVCGQQHGRMCVKSQQSVYSFAFRLTPPTTRSGIWKKILMFIWDGKQTWNRESQNNTRGGKRLIIKNKKDIIYICINYKHIKRSKAAVHTGLKEFVISRWDFVTSSGQMWKIIHLQF